LANVAANFESALEYNAEAFATVIMLYVPCNVNGVSVPAFVDSGAQSTIMSQECAQRCNLLRLLDKRYSGMAKGVGSAKILGRIHACTIQIGKEHFTTSITVLQK
jgi:DNA damage-inducible protein 1